MNRKSNLQYMAIALLFCAVLILMGCSSHRSITVKDRELTEEQAAGFNAMTFNKEFLDTAIDAVLTLEKQQYAIDYQDISKKKFREFETLANRAIKLNNTYSELYWDHLNGKGGASEVIHYSGLLMQNKEKIIDILQEFDLWR